jgi:GTP-binding protein
VRVGPERSFVIADIPGLVEGASEGAGLGARFLRHLARTRLLLHLVDIAPLAPDADPVRDVRAIEAELGRFSEDLARRPRWLVLNKVDLLPEELRAPRCAELVARLGWEGPFFCTSGLTGEGCRELVQRVMAHLENQAAGQGGSG